MLKLGATVDIGVLAATVDWNTAGATGKRACLKNAQSCIFVATAAVAGAGTDDDVFTVQQHTAATSGTTSNLLVSTYWVKSATALAGTETWTRVDQAASQTITLAGATYAAKQYILAVQINTKDLIDGYDYASMSVADPGSGGSRLGSMLTLLTDLTVRRDPANLQPTLF